MDKVDTGINGGAPHKNHIVDLAGVPDLHGPRRASDAVARRQVSRQRYSPERHALAIGDGVVHT